MQRTQYLAEAHHVTTHSYYDAPVFKSSCGNSGHSRAEMQPSTTSYSFIGCRSMDSHALGKDLGHEGFRRTYAAC
jgi:hypothetical protein